MSKSTPVDIARRNFLLISLGAVISTPAMFSLSEAYALKSKKSIDSTLENRIVSFIDGTRSKGEIESDEKSSWVTYNLKTNESLVSIDADVPMQSASMHKPFLALLFLHKMYEGKISQEDYDKAVIEDIDGKKTAKGVLEGMIRWSNNSYSNWVLSRLGGPEGAQRLIETDYKHIFHNTKIVEYIPESGPNEGKTYNNKASANDYLRFLKAMWNDELSYSNELKRLMKLPKRMDRLVQNVPEIPFVTDVYDKTGSTAMLCGDMGVIVAKNKKGDECPYIMIGIIEKDTRASDYRIWISQRANIIRKVSGMAYDFMKRYLPNS